MIRLATVALDGAQNAGILAAQILGTVEPTIADHLAAFKEGLRTRVLDAAQ